MWESLIAHAKDEDMMESWGATKSLGIAFAKMPDKEQAMKDLFALLKDENIYVRAMGFNALNEVFTQLTPFSENTVSKIEIGCDKCGSITIHECKAGPNEYIYKCEKMW